MEENGGDIGPLKSILDDVYARMDSLVESGGLNETQKQHLIDWMKRVFDKITIKYEKVQKEVDSIMEGYILHTRTDDIWDQGMEYGLKQGLEQGALQGSQLERKESAERMRKDGLSLDKIAQYVNENVETVKGWFAPQMMNV